MKPPREIWIKHNNTVLFLTALTTRLVMHAIAGPGNEDDGTFARMADNILAGRGPVCVPWGFTKIAYSWLQPAFAYLLAGSFRIFGESLEPLRLAFTLWSALTCVWLTQSGEMLMGKKGRLAGWWLALYPPQIFWSTRVITHTMATNFLTGAIWLIARYQIAPGPAVAGILGLSWGLISLSRGEFLQGFVLVPLFFFYAKRSRWIKDALIATSFLALSLAPWAIRNWRIHHRLILQSTCYGHNLWFSFNPQYRFTGDAIPLTPELIAQGEGKNEVEQAQLLAHDALRFIKENPGRALYIWLGNLVHFWRPFLSPKATSLSQNILYIVSYLPVFVFFLTALWRLPYRSQPAWIFLALLVLYKWGVHSIFYIIVRFREAIAPVMILIATWGLLEAISALQKHRAYRKGLAWGSLSPLPGGEAVH